jgi:CBS domain-containing protein
MIPIKPVMTREVVTVTPKTPVYEALNLFIKHEISGMPVVDEENNVVGILSEKDVMEILIDKNLDEKKFVEDYMSTEVTSFSEEADAVDICRFFARSHIRRVPIVKDGKLVGIVSRRDIVKIIQEAYARISSFRFA